MNSSILTVAACILLWSPHRTLLPRKIFIFFSFLLPSKSADMKLFSPQTSSIKHQASSIKHQASSIKHQASSIKHQASSIKHQASSIKHQASSIK
ncbi:hypothetical protein QUF72_15875, partial [Desulfobacterales bacterium HSG2]|nr:hypothetical protein [Desulfobacterales bacterium HSG2]